MIVRFIGKTSAATVVACVLAGSTAFAGGQTTSNKAAPPLPITFSDGAIATPYDHCGDADLCANIRYADGDALLVYSEGAGRCQPYSLHFVRVHNAVTLYEFSRALNHATDCGNAIDTRFTFDRGLIHLTVGQYEDGTLRFVFSAAN
jgi:hypothetical protein